MTSSLNHNKDSRVNAPFICRLLPNISNNLGTSYENHGKRHETDFSSYFLQHQGKEKDKSNNKNFLSFLALTQRVIFFERKMLFSLKKKVIFFKMKMCCKQLENLLNVGFVFYHL